MSVMEPATDETLMARFIRDDDRSSFGRLLRRYAPVATGVAVRLLGSREEARDAVQETFVNILRARSGYRPDSPFGPWFYRILRNVCLDLLRKRKSYRNALDRFAGEVTKEEVPPQEHGNGFPLLELVGRLPEKDRRVLLLRVVDGLSLGEIAELCGCTEEAIKKRAQRGLKRLRTLMEHEQSATGHVQPAPPSGLVSVSG